MTDGKASPLSFMGEGFLHKIRAGVHRPRSVTFGQPRRNFSEPDQKTLPIPLNFKGKKSLMLFSTHQYSFYATLLPSCLVAFTLSKSLIMDNVLIS